MFLISLTIRSGKNAGFLFLSGLVVGCFIHTLFLSFGFSIFILESKFVFDLLKLFGFSYIMFLAIELCFSKEQNNFKGDLELKSSYFNFFKKGVLMNLLNPKVFLFFVAFFPNFIFSQTISIEIQLIYLGLIFICSTILVFGILVIFSNSFYSKFNKTSNSNKIVKYINVIVLLIISILILFTENNLTLE
jgi:threonine/homoserine/homoserine lactone efflux protein